MTGDADEMTVLYGSSDDLIEIEGGYEGEVSFFNPDEQTRFVGVVFSDGTVAEIGYGKGSSAIWQINVIRRGDLFHHVEICTDEDAERYSDQLFLKPGIKWAYVATEWKKAR